MEHGAIKPGPAALLRELLVAEPTPVGLVLLKPEGLARQQDAQRDGGQRAMRDSPPDIAPGTLLHAETNTHEARPRHHVATRAIAGEDHQRQDREKRDIEDPDLHQDLGFGFRLKHEMHAEIEQDHLDQAQIDGKDDNRDEKAEEFFKPGSGIFRPVAAQVDRRPDIAPDAGLAPEAVNAKGEESQQPVHQRKAEKRTAGPGVTCRNGGGFEIKHGHYFCLTRPAQ